MARSKQVSDEEIVTATMGCVKAHGPSLTLAEVGEIVGLSAATVMQRFGSKRELMRQVVDFRMARVAAMRFEGEGNPVDRIIDGLVSLSDWIQTPTDIANVAASLHTDIADPEFRKVIDAGFRNHRIVIAQVLQEAIDAGQLKPCETDVIARLMQLTVLGAQQSWAMEPRGELHDWIATCLRNFIAPWRVTDEENAMPT